MHYLIPHYHAYCLSDEYADFIGTLTWYRMYCACKVSETKRDYQNGYKNLETRINDLKYTNEIPSYVFRAADKLLEDIGKILRKRNFDSGSLAQIGDLLYEFETNTESKFREHFLETALDGIGGRYYTESLFKKVQQLFDTGANDSIITESFKFLDKRLQDLLQLSTHESYGEDLIKRAFAPNTGSLQLNTHSNEQTGIRNFYSGANALFRNPSAHRSLFSGDDALFPGESDEFAAAIFSMIDIMSRMAIGLYAAQKRPAVTRVLHDFAAHRGWNTSIYTYKALCCVGHIPGTPLYASDSYRVQVNLVDSNLDIFCMLKHASTVEKSDVDSLTSSLAEIYDFRIEQKVFAQVANRKNI